MKYTNTLLTIIAACLIILVGKSFTQNQMPLANRATDVNIVGVSTNLPVLVQNQPTETNFKSPLDVVIAGTTEDLPVHIQNQTLNSVQDVRIVDTANNIPVIIRNTVDISQPIKADISSIGGGALAGTVLPVVVGNTVEADITGLNGHLAHLPTQGDAFPVAIYSR